MKQYISLFRIRFVNGLQYRAAAFAGLVTQFAWGFMEILAFSAFYHADPAAFPMEFQHLVSYIWIQQAFFAIFFVCVALVVFFLFGDSGRGALWGVVFVGYVKGWFAFWF